MTGTYLIITPPTKSIDEWITKKHLRQHSDCVRESLESLIANYDMFKVRGVNF
jgi:hypothetical protein